MKFAEKCLTFGYYICRSPPKKIQQRTMFRKSEAPAAERNKSPILDVLKGVIKGPNSEDGVVRVLEISSGTGQHVAHFAKNLNQRIFWQPTEFDTSQFSSICAYIKQDGLTNVAPPVYVDIRQHHTEWKPEFKYPENTATNVQPILEFKENSFDYIYNANMIHISSFDCTEGLFLNSGKLLKKGGCLITYGPYGQNGVISPESNVQFDRGLRHSNPSWGIRDIQLQLLPLASKNKLNLISVIEMPANNKTLIWQKD